MPALLHKQERKRPRPQRWLPWQTLTRRSLLLLGMKPLRWLQRTKVPNTWPTLRHRLWLARLWPELQKLQQQMHKMQALPPVLQPKLPKRVPRLQWTLQ